MNKKEVLKELETIIYPDLEKNIVELKLIYSLHVKPKSLHVTIDTNNKEAFNFMARTIVLEI
jgi:metal-sulfur cluster biosynthetic enzyme